MFPLSEAFGAWRVVDRGGGRVYDFAPLQGETIEEDLRAARLHDQRDGAGRVGGGDLIDPLGGRADLEARTLRVIGPEAYERDPLRALRLARFAAELGLRARPATPSGSPREAAAARAPRPSGERVFAELRRLVARAGRASTGLALADRLGLLAGGAARARALHGVEQSHYHHLDVYGHTLEVLERQIELERLDECSATRPSVREVLDEPLGDELTRGQALRFGALLHDIGKPATRDVRRRTAASRSSATTGSARRWCAQALPAAAHERAAQRASSPAVTRHHLVLGFLVHERPLDRARGLPLPEAHLAGRGRGHAAVVRRPARHARQERRARDRGAPRAGARADGRPRSTGARTGPPRPPLRGDELAREAGHRARARSWAALLPSCEEAAYAGEVDKRDEAVELARRLRHNAVSMIVDCAVYEDGRRARRAAGLERRLEACRGPARSSGSGCTSRPRRSSTRSSASSTSTSSRSRTP